LAIWVKNVVMLAVTGVWVAVVLTNLFRGILPDPVTWGVPGGIYFALNPTLPLFRRGGEAPEAGK
jgi:hypothetical protein